MESFDSIVVGGGLAGALLAFSLERKGQKVVLYSFQQEGESTRVSSGLVNPVTGMRFVKTWNIEVLLDELVSFYRNIESILNIEILYQTDIVVRLETAAEENAWLSRSGEEEYKQWISSEEEMDEFKHVMIDSLSLGKIRNAWRVDIQGLMNAVNHYLGEKGVLRNEKFNYTELISHGTGWLYQNATYCEHIVFCEGFRINENPFFNWLPVYPLKGEHITVTIDEFALKDVILGHYTLIPWKNGSYWLGANYQVNDIQMGVTSAERQLQEEFLQQTLIKPFRTIHHDYGIRPASRDRRPMVGEHPSCKGMHVMNGFGTKGTSLTPYCVSQLIDSIIDHMSLSTDIDIKRFVKKGYYKNN